jgi:hypothetical protein
MPIQAEHIARVRTVKAEELELTGKTLDTWTRIYLLFPYKLTCGPRLSSSCRRLLDSGKVLVAENSKGIAQVFARVINIPSGLFVEEIVTAPWNNSLCIKYLEKEGSEKFWSSPAAQKELPRFASAHEVGIQELITAHKGSGAIMMFALYHFAKVYGARSISLDSNPEAFDFYPKIGMRQVHKDEPTFALIISDDVAEGLAEKVRKYFLAHTA